MERNYTFPIAALTLARAKLTWAQLEVDPTKADELQLIISGDDESVEELRVEETGGVITIAQPQLAYAKELLPRNRWLQICLRLPTAWHGDLDVDTVSGTIGAHSLSGAEVSLTSVSGSINVRDINAKLLWLHTVSGAIAGTGLTAQRANLRSISGNISLASAALENIKLFTISGGVTLALEPGICSMDGQTVSGTIGIETDGPVRAALHALSGQFTLSDSIPQGDGGLDVSISSVSGNLNITKRRNPS